MFSVHGVRQNAEDDKTASRYGKKDSPMGKSRQSKTSASQTHYGA